MKEGKMKGIYNPSRWTSPLPVKLVQTVGDTKYRFTVDCRRDNAVSGYDVRVERWVPAKRGPGSFEDVGDSTLPFARFGTFSNGVQWGRESWRICISSHAARWVRAFTEEK
jgi:hypothetical protein